MKDYAQKLAENITLTSGGCHEWAGFREKNGYGRTRYQGQNMLAHRFAWTVHHGPIPAGKLVCHKCDNPPCCNPDHLFLGSHKANTRDAMAKGRLEANLSDLAVITRFRRHRKLTDAQVDEIRASAEKLTVIAKRLGVTPACISQIRNGTRKYAPVRPAPAVIECLD